MSKAPTFSEFTFPSHEDWLAEAHRTLKGKPLEKLTWQTQEGFSMAPYLDPKAVTALQSSWVHGNAFNAMDAGWQSVQPIPMGDVSLAKKLVEDALQHEVVAFLCYGDAPVANYEAVWSLLDLQQHALHLDPGAHSKNVWERLVAYAQEIGVEDALTGNLFAKTPVVIQHSFPLPYFRQIGIDVSWTEEEGLPVYMQMAVALGQMSDQLAQAVDVETMAKHLAFRFATGTSFWLEVAKYRSFRMLVAKVLEVYGVQDAYALSPFIVAETGLYSTSRFDAHNNMLRATTAAVAAAVGGAHGIAIHPHNRILGQPSVADARLARNISHLMRHESYLHLVADPAGGSTYVEEITHQVATQAWQFFQEVESQGGWQEYAKTDSWTQRKSDVQAAQQTAIYARKKSFIGVSDFPNPTETLSASVSADDTRPLANLERLRLTSQDVIPEATLLLWGDLKMLAARSAFARNLLGVAGISAQEVVWTGKALGKHVKLICLCASDEDYTEDAIQAIAQAHPEAYILVAGKPQKTSSDIKGTIFFGVDVFAVLSQIQQHFTPKA